MRTSRIVKFEEDASLTPVISANNNEYSEAAFALDSNSKGTYSRDVTE